MRDEGFSFVEQICDLGFGGYLFGSWLSGDVGYLGILGVGVEKCLGLQMLVSCMYVR